MDQNFPLEWTGELSSYDNHPADIGSESFEMEKMMTLNNNQQKLLDDINDAIEKIEKGTYGICETCSSEIDYERLKAIPYARECINCAKARLTNEDEYQRRRPIEEELLEPMIDNGLVKEMNWILPWKFTGIYRFMVQLIICRIWEDQLKITMTFIIFMMLQLNPSKRWMC